ncbi:phosphopantetheine-binding protein [Azospirillum doebereinerae]|uniref:Acyl carrier protein n=1 Tax=Azospirillum doebereinerae TaxID=92933 RepID=A0A3S0V2Z2_9PROT|nr:phosphopantetheine-binding protein [Azospirillum doebereinerae]MCG5238492.1 phosphopantetheine-binding protein [Azospirillum doebereinerae]RUQ74572.1 acyl carrier protein [Azospirillum doebereinerae]
MDRKDFLLALDDVLELDPGTLTGAETLESLDSWDSLAVISFIALVDETMNVVVEGEKLAQAKTVDDLLALAGVAVTA